MGQLLAFARRSSLDFMILTDHNSICGSRNLKCCAKAVGLPIEIPLAAEYRTDQGDLIAAFIEREIMARDLNGFLIEVRSQGGLVLLPHPLTDHCEPERLSAQADLIEAFNGRVEHEENEAARMLALQFGKPTYFASDAHLAASLGRVVVSVDRSGTLKESLLRGHIQAVPCLPACRGDVFLSQVVKAVKTRDLKMAVHFGLRLLRKLARQT